MAIHGDISSQSGVGVESMGRHQNFTGDQKEVCGRHQYICKESKHSLCFGFFLACLYTFLPLGINCTLAQLTRNKRPADFTLQSGAVE